MKKSKNQKQGKKPAKKMSLPKLKKEIIRAEKKLDRKQIRIDKKIARLKIKLDSIKARFEKKIKKIEDESLDNRFKITQINSLLSNLDMVTDIQEKIKKE